MSRHGLYIPVYETLPKHPKLYRLFRFLSNGRPMDVLGLSDECPFYTIGTLVCFWLHAMRFYPEGGIPKDEILDVFQCIGVRKGDENLLLEGMIEHDFLLENDREYVIVDWEDYGGKLNDKRHKDKERKKAERKRNAKAQKQRSNHNQNNGETSNSEVKMSDGRHTDCPTDVTRMSTPKKEKENKEKEYSPEPEKSPGSRTEHVIFFNTKRKDEIHGITADKFAEYQATFPYLDVMAEFKKAKLWLDENPTRRKSKQGMGKFLLGWLDRAKPNGFSPTSQTPSQKPLANSLKRSIIEKATDHRDRHNYDLNTTMHQFDKREWENRGVSKEQIQAIIAYLFEKSEKTP